MQPLSPPHSFPHRPVAKVFHGYHHSPKQVQILQNIETLLMRRWCAWSLLTPTSFPQRSVNMTSCCEGLTWTRWARIQSHFFHFLQNLSNRDNWCYCFLFIWQLLCKSLWPMLHKGIISLFIRPTVFSTICSHLVILDKTLSNLSFGPHQ